MSNETPRRLESAGTTDEPASNQQLPDNDATVAVCPQCGSRQVRKRRPQRPRAPQQPRNYYCNACYSRLEQVTHVPEADAPPLQSGKIGQSEHGRLLLEADPDDFGGDA